MPSPPLSLLLDKLSNAHLTSLSRMSGSRSATTLSGLSVTSRSFWYNSSVYSCHLFLMSYSSVRSVPFLSFIMSIFAQNVPFISPIFLSRSLVFPFMAAENIINLISVLPIWWCPCIELPRVVGKECLWWPACSLDKTLLFFALLHFELQGQTYLLFILSLDSLL